MGFIRGGNALWLAELSTILRLQLEMYEKGRGKKSKLSKTKRVLKMRLGIKRWIGERKEQGEEKKNPGSSCSGF